MKASARARKGTTVLLPWQLRQYVIPGNRSEFELEMEPTQSQPKMMAIPTYGTNVLL